MADSIGSIHRATVDENGKLRARVDVWNTSSLAWEAATGSLTGGAAVQVNNFPAAMSTTAQDTTLDPLGRYKITDTDTTSNPKYYGFAAIGGNWYIMKEDTGALTYRYAKGTASYTTNWTNRAILSYDYIFNTF